MHALRGCLGLFLPCFQEPVGADDDFSELEENLRLIDSSYRNTEYFNALHDAFKACYSFSSMPIVDAWGLSKNLTSDFKQLYSLKGSRSKEECDKAIGCGIPRYIVAEIVGDAVELQDIGEIQGRYVKAMDEECPICIEPMASSDYIARTLLRVHCCGNFLHKTCLDGWKQKSCVSCRAAFDRTKNGRIWQKTLDTIHKTALIKLQLLTDEELARELIRQEQAQIDAENEVSLVAARRLALEITQEV